MFRAGVCAWSTCRTVDPGSQGLQPGLGQQTVCLREEEGPKLVLRESIIRFLRRQVGGLSGLGVAGTEQSHFLVPLIIPASGNKASDYVRTSECFLEDRLDLSSSGPEIIVAQPLLDTVVYR